MKRISVDVEFEIGEVVYLRCELDRAPGMVTGLTIRPGGLVYEISWPSLRDSTHYAIELTREYVPEYAAGD
jgi:hypothetical protein